MADFEFLKVEREGPLTIVTNQNLAMSPATSLARGLSS